MKKSLAILLFIINFVAHAGTLTSSVSNLPSYGNCILSMASSAQYFVLNGSGLSTQVIITAPDNFEISTTCNGQFSSRPITILALSGNVINVYVFVRASPTALGNLSGSINISNASVSTLLINVSCVGINYSVPSGYYSSTLLLAGSALKTALYNKILGHNAVSYSSLWTQFTNTDTYYNGKVWDIYSTSICGPFANYTFTYPINQCGNFTNEGDCYNREHSMPQSWFASATPIVSDMFHIYPTDAKVNGIRSNDTYGEVATSTTSGTPSQAGCKSGANTFSFLGGYTGNAFEPIDEYKGDLARGYFYLATRYENLIASWFNNSNASDALVANAFPAFKSWFVAMLIKWHNQDPVSMKEINRNNAIYSIQGNRNPYIDSPQFVQKIWGGNFPAKPTVAASDLNVSQLIISPTVTLSLKWKSGNGNKRIVVARAGAQVNASPLDSMEYIASNTFGAGAAISGGNYVVYNGMGSNAVVANLSVGTSYYFKIFEYSGTQKTAQYLLSSAATCGCN